jgi:PTH1 family peptidyl-tRNA hydrolase
MWLIVGLGNPEKKYSGNRHNVGFMVADEIRSAVGAPEWKNKWGGRSSKGTAWGDDLTLLEPLTYMNLSGECVQPAAAFLKIGPEGIVVVHDELDLAFGEVRLKVGGGHAGHNGLRSIIARLGSPEFVRVRVGVGRPPPEFRGDVADWVLTDFDKAERSALPDIVGRAVDAVHRVVENGLPAAMNVVNTKGK